MRNSRSRRGARPDSERNVAGVGELRAVAERLLETGAHYLEQGREWLHAATRREQDDDRPHAAGDEFDGPRSGFHRGRADAGRAGWSTPPRQGSEAGYGRYAPDEYSFSDTGGDFDARTRRGAHDYDDRPAREFDARADDLARRRRQAGAHRHYGSQPDDFASHDDDFLPGSYGFGGEGRGQPQDSPATGARRGQGTRRGGEEAFPRWEQAYRAQGQGSHRGRGPRGYTRSDARILEEVNERLCDDPIVDASDIEVRCEQGCVVLEGKVPTRWMKHRAEDIADSISGVRDLDNRIRVAAEEPAAHGDFDTRTTTGAGAAAASGDTGNTRRSGGPAGTGSATGSPGSVGSAGGSGSTGSSESAGSTSSSGSSGSAGGSSSSGGSTSAGSASGQGAPGNAQSPPQPH